MRRILIAVSLLLGFVATASAQQNLKNYQPGNRLINGSQLNNMVGVVNNLQGASTAAPVLTSCGTSPTVSGSNAAGLVTMGTGSPTGCVITFAKAFNTVPFCTVVWQTNLASMIYTYTASAITLTQTATSSNLVNYRCIAAVQ